MIEKTLFSIRTPYREDIEVRGWYFGESARKTVAVVGALRGNEVQQVFTCGCLIRKLKTMEAEGRLPSSVGILVVPTVSSFSMNVDRRFWAGDNSDINRMFPGYDQGEATQRIAASLFQALEGYEYGIQLTSFFLPGHVVPHYRVTDTGYGDPGAFRSLGLPYGLQRTPKPYDTTTLNYNWQIWNTKSCSLYTGRTNTADEKDASFTVDAILRFLAAQGFIRCRVKGGVPCQIRQESELMNVICRHGGVLIDNRQAGTFVRKGERLGEIMDPCTAAVLQVLKAPCDGVIFFSHRGALMRGRDTAYRIMPETEAPVFPERIPRQEDSQQQE